MPTNLPRFGFCVVLILTAACGPLVPLSYNKENFNNQLSQTIETEDATVHLQYIQTLQGHYIFDLEIINQSLEDVYIAPQFISFYASPKLFKPIQNLEDDVHALSEANSSLTMKRHFANSPSATRKIYHDRVKSKGTGVILFAVLTAGLILYDAAKDAEDSKKETWTKKDESKAFSRDLLIDAAVVGSEIAKESYYQAQDDRQYIPYELFPEYNIISGKSVRGKISIPLEISYRYQRIVVPVGNIDYIFDFKRRGVKSTQSQSQHHLLAGAQRK